MFNPKIALTTVLTCMALASAGPVAAQTSTPPKDFDQFMKSCSEVVSELYTDPDLLPILQSPADSTTATCSCMANQLTADRKFQKMFTDANSGNQKADESKKTQAFLMGRFMSVVFACASLELDKAVNGMGLRGVG
jgi:hypothetical protein